MEKLAKVMKAYGTKLEREIHNIFRFQAHRKVGLVNMRNLIVRWAYRIKELRRMTINYRTYLN